jgi:hypothetical protein
LGNARAQRLDLLRVIGKDGRCGHGVKLGVIHDVSGKGFSQHELMRDLVLVGITVHVVSLFV